MPVDAQGALLLGRYRVIRPLGSGGMARVFLCEDERLRRRVAVKRLHAHSPEDVARRFLREARLGASLSHPGLVSVFDTATDDEGVLIVMEYVEGQTLAEAVASGPLPADRAVAIVGEVAAALDHAHAHGVVHRDVKPANVLLRDDGVVKLADLGIATAADVTRITRSGVVLGTAYYLAPEVLDGREAGPAADVYALAAVAFEALSGRRAREGRSPMEIAHRVTSEPPPDLRDAWRDAPRAAAEAMRRGMARDPERRPSSAGELAAQLRSALAPPVRPALPARGGRRRSPVAPLALAALLLAVAGVALVAALSGGGDGERSASEPPAKPEPRQREQAREEPQPRAEQPAAPAPAPAGGDATSGAQLNGQGFALMRQGRYREAVPILRRAVESFPAGTSDLTYAYALYNLGRSLRLSGRPAEAIPVLERRLRIPNQRDTVRRELEAARRAAG